MKTKLKNSDELASTAKIVDGKLILSLPGALKPTVWQMDFDQYAASALEVNEQDKQFILSLKTPKGKDMEIAPFETREEAVQGLIAASQALEEGQGKIRPASNDAGAVALNVAQAKPKKGWVTPVLAVLFLFALFFVWASLAPIPPGSLSQGGSSAVGSPAASTGVPMSAEDFLNQR